MPKYKILAAGHAEVDRAKNGDIIGKRRYVKGDTVEMDEKDAFRLVQTGGLVLASEADKEPEAVVTVESTGASDGSPLATAGPGGTLVLTDEGAAAQPEDPTEDPSGDGDVEDYTGDNWDKAALVAEAERRDLPKSGNMDELRERLVDNDAAQSA